MSVLIKGMEMPKSCWVCEVGGAAQMDNATCPFYSMEYWEQENYQDKIADGCPLVPVPPHVEHHDSNGCWNCEHYAVPVAWCAIDEGIYCATSCRDWKKKTPEALAKYLSKGDKA